MFRKIQKHITCTDDALETLFSNQDIKVIQLVALQIENVFKLKRLYWCKKSESMQIRKTPLHDAANGGYVLAFQLIIENQSDKTPKDNYGRTPLHCAARIGKDIFRNGRFNRHLLLLL